MGKNNLRQIITFMGAVLAYMMGSGFATGQELLQYYVSYGYKSILVGATLAAILIFANWGFARAGHQGGFSKGSEIFTYYCGGQVGKIFDWFTTLFCFMSFIVMLAGAGSTLEQQYRLPLIIGIIAMAVFAALTVSCGLNSLVEIIGKVGPVLAVCVLLIGITTLICHGGNIEPNMARIDSGELPLLKASENWFLAGISNGGMSLLILAGFMAKLGSTNKLGPLMAGQTMGILLYAIISVLIGFALISQVDFIAGAQIPNLVLANDISPILGYLFGLVIFAAIYTTACPLLWTTASRIAQEGTFTFKLITCILAIVGVLLAVSVPFDILINYIYVLNGYGGAIFLLFMIFKESLSGVGHLRDKILGKSSRQPPKHKG